MMPPLSPQEAKGNVVFSDLLALVCYPIYKFNVVNDCNFPVGHRNIILEVKICCFHVAT